MSDELTDQPSTEKRTSLIGILNLGSFEVQELSRAVELWEERVHFCQARARISHGLRSGILTELCLASCALQRSQRLPDCVCSSGVQLKPSSLLLIQMAWTSAALLARRVYVAVVYTTAECAKRRDTTGFTGSRRSSDGKSSRTKGNVARGKGGGNSKGKSQSFHGHRSHCWSGSHKEKGCRMAVTRPRIAKRLLRVDVVFAVLEQSCSCASSFEFDLM